MSAILVLVGIIGILIPPLVHLALELRQRDKHLRWIDERDKHFVTLFEHAWDLTMIPRGNPLDVFKAHGMLAKDAFMRAGDPGSGILQALDERMGVVTKGLDFTVKAAKALRLWEQQHPAPPVHYWEAGGVGRWWSRFLNGKPDGRLSDRPHAEQEMPKTALPAPTRALEEGPGS